MPIHLYPGRKKTERGIVKSSVSIRLATTVLPVLPSNRRISQDFLFHLHPPQHPSEFDFAPESCHWSSLHAKSEPSSGALNVDISASTPLFQRGFGLMAIGMDRLRFLDCILAGGRKGFGFTIRRKIRGWG